MIKMKTKMKLLASLKIWVVIYPSITLLLYFFGHYLSGIPLLLRTFILTVSLVPWIVFVGLPLLESAIGKLSGKRNGQ
jgi:antibiotic biosynthesis monooxygenase (ABM) superfamily enzyme